MPSKSTMSESVTVSQSNAFKKMAYEDNGHGHGQGLGHERDLPSIHSLKYLK